MQLKNLFEVIFKIMGVYLIIRAITYIPHILSFVSFYQSSDSNLSALLGTVAVTLIMAAVFLLIGMFLIRRSEKVTKWIVPEERLAEDFTTFKVHRSVLLTIAIIVMGGVILLFEVPKLSVTLYEWILHNRENNGYPQFDKKGMLVSVIRIFLALYLLFNSKIIVSWIELKRK